MLHHPSDQYVLGAPLFKRARIHFENGNTMTISAPTNSDSNIYIKRLTLNGEEYTRNYITFSALTAGGRLDATMSPTPNKSRGTANSDLPYSFSVQ